MADYNTSDNIRLPPKWIELNLSKRECSTFIAVPGDETICQCGRRKIDHGDFVKHQYGHNTWSPILHTRTFSTDAYGTILFEGEQHPNKAHYARVSYDTNPEIIVQLMRYVWGLHMPKLIISVRGGTANFDMSTRLGKIFQTGLIKAAKSTSAWVFSYGLNSGIAKHLGTALGNEKWIAGSRRGRIVSVGISPWGMCEHHSQLVGRNKDKVYSPLEYIGSKFLHLNPRHSNFLLVDNGCIGKFGGENHLRRRLEKCISAYPTSHNRGCDTPIIVIVVEGGVHTLRMVNEYLYDEPPIPCVIFAGSGKCANVIASVVKKYTTEQEFDAAKVDILRKISHAFHTNITLPIYEKLREIFQRRNLITVYDPNLASQEEDFDAVILASIFRSQHWSPLQQLSLSLVWNRVDIAQAEVFVYGREWSRDHLEHAMTEALVSNRLDFINLLLEHGLNMQSYLTASRLESLYSTEKMKSSLMYSLLKEFAKPHSSKRKQETDIQQNNLTLHDIGIALSHMLDHMYRSNYIHIVAKSHNSKEQSIDDQEVRAQTFLQPFDDLFIWAILTNRHDMAKVLWLHGHGALAKALIAVKLNKYLASEITSSEKTMTNVVLDFEHNSEEWENLALTLLDTCYRQNSKMTRTLLIMELNNWSKLTCLTLAVVAKHRVLLGHPCSQLLLADLWSGALNIKSHSTLKITLGILFPPLLFLWDYKSKEGLELVPHHQEKHELFPYLNSNLKSEEELERGAVSVLTLDDMSLRSFSNQKSRGNVFGAFKSRSDRRKTDLAEITKKIVWNERFSSNEIFPVRAKEMDSFATKSEYPVQKGSEEAEPTPEPSYHRDSHRSQPQLKFRHPLNNAKRSSFVTTQQNLSPWNKFIEFQKAPVTNFARHTIGYIVFLVALAYVLLYPQDEDHFGWMEIYVISHVAVQGLECIREFMAIDALSFAQKLIHLQENWWQIADFCLVLFFLTGTALRLDHKHSVYYQYGMLIYRTSSIYWNFRLYKFMGVHKFVGPKILMMSKMFSHMVCFAMVILVVIFSFGVARESIRFPNSERSISELIEAFLEPYVMMFGEVELDSLNMPCKDLGSVTEECPLGYWLVPLFWVVYMLVANILIVNVLIAVFNGIYLEIDSIALEVWLFERFKFVMEFEQKPLLPPPFMILCHVISFLRCIYKTCERCMCEEELLEEKMDDDDKPHIIMGNDHSLKSFLSPAEQHMVFDFEDDNVSTLHHLLYKESSRTIAPNDNIPPHRGEGGSEKISMQIVKMGLHELQSEIDGQRHRLDKLITFWEIDIEKHNKDQVGHIIAQSDESLSSSSSLEQELDPVQNQ